MKIIVLTGWSESGKDTAADILVKDYGFTKYAIADPLKDLCAELYSFPRELADTQEGKRTPWNTGSKTKTIREILLDTARLERSRFGDDIYVNTIISTIKNTTAENIVISDLRYFTELTPIKTFAETNAITFDIWNVVREGQDVSPVNDPSEYMLERLEPNFILHNSGTSIVDLEEKIYEYMSRTNELPDSQNEPYSCCIM